MKRVTVNSRASLDHSLGDFPSQTVALEALAEYILASFPPHISLQIVREGEFLHVYSVQTKIHKKVRKVTFTKEMELSIKEVA